jgi:hypothetical protein
MQNITAPDHRRIHVVSTCARKLPTGFARTLPARTRMLTRATFYNLNAVPKCAHRSFSPLQGTRLRQ